MNIFWYWTGTEGCLVFINVKKILIKFHLQFFYHNFNFLLFKYSILINKETLKVNSDSLYAFITFNINYTS